MAVASRMVLRWRPVLLAGLIAAATLLAGCMGSPSDAPTSSGTGASSPVPGPAPTPGSPVSPPTTPGPPAPPAGPTACGIRWSEPGLHDFVATRNDFAEPGHSEGIAISTWPGALLVSLSVAPGNVSLQVMTAATYTTFTAYSMSGEEGLDAAVHLALQKLFLVSGSEEESMAQAFWNSAQPMHNDPPPGGTPTYGSYLSKAYTRTVDAPALASLIQTLGTPSEPAYAVDMRLAVYDEWRFTRYVPSFSNRMNGNGSPGLTVAQDDLVDFIAQGAIPSADAYDAAHDALVALGWTPRLDDFTIVNCSG